MILRVRRENYPDIMLTDSLGSIIVVNNHWKYVILFSKAFLDGWDEITLATHTDGQRFMYYINSCLFVHIQ